MANGSKRRTVVFGGPKRIEIGIASHSSHLF